MPQLLQHQEILDIVDHYLQKSVRWNILTILTYLENMVNAAGWS